MSVIKRKPPLTTPQVGVGAVVFKDDAVLLVKRGRPPSKNEWAIPGGKVKLGETLQQAAEREILEETGVRIRALEPMYTFELIEKNNQGHIQWHYVITDLSTEYLSGEPIAASDAEQARWVKRNQLKKIKTNQTTRRLLEDKFKW